jgi:hypothetical protein
MLWLRSISLIEVNCFGHLLDSRAWLRHEMPKSIFRFLIKNKIYIGLNQMGPCLSLSNKNFFSPFCFNGKSLPG